MSKKVLANLNFLLSSYNLYFYSNLSNIIQTTVEHRLSLTLRKWIQCIGINPLDILGILIVSYPFFSRVFRIAHINSVHKCMHISKNRHARSFMIAPKCNRNIIGTFIIIMYLYSYTSLHAFLLPQI